MDIQESMIRTLGTDLRRALTREQKIQLDEVLGDAFRQKKDGKLNCVASRLIMIRIAEILGPRHRDLVQRLEELPWPHRVRNQVKPQLSGTRSVNEALVDSLGKELRRHLTCNERRLFSSLLDEVMAEVNAGRFDFDSSLYYVTRLSQVIGHHRDLMKKLLNVIPWPHQVAHTQLEALGRDMARTMDREHHRTALSILKEMVREIKAGRLDPEKKGVLMVRMYSVLEMYPDLMSRFTQLPWPTSMWPSQNERTDE